MNENFSKGRKTILKYARSEAKRLNSSFVNPEHLFLGIIKDKDGQANKMLRSLGCDLNEMSLMLADLSHSKKSKHQPDQLKLTQNTERIIRNTFAESSKYNRKTANQIDLLLTIVKHGHGIINDVIKFYSRIRTYYLCGINIFSAQHFFSKNIQTHPGTAIPRYRFPLM